MSRLSRRRRSLTLVATTLVALAVPAAAQAATYTVKAGDGACGGGDLACGGLVEAAAAAAAGDVFNVAPGTYSSAKFTTDVTINGDLGFVVDGTLEFAGGARLEALEGRRGDRRGQRARRSTSAAAAASSSATRSWSAATASASSSPPASATRSCAAGSRPAAQATGAIQVQTGPDDANVDVTVESSVLTGGGAGIRALTRNNEVEALAGRRAGDINLTLRHITAAGSTNGIDLDSSNARALLGGATGNITATVTDSIAFNNRVVNFPGTLASPLGANTAELTRTRTMESGDPPTLFLDPAKGNFRLRPDASRGDRPGRLHARRVDDRHRRRGSLGGADGPRRRRVQQRRAGREDRARDRRRRARPSP